MTKGIETPNISPIYTEEAYVAVSPFITKFLLTNLKSAMLYKLD
jgi:hypothetical protein